MLENEEVQNDVLEEDPALEDLDAEELTITRTIYENDKALRAIYLTGDMDAVFKAAQDAAQDRSDSAMNFLLAKMGGDKAAQDAAYIETNVAQTTAVLALVYYRVLTGHEFIAKMNEKFDPSEAELSDKENLNAYFEHLNNVQFATGFGKLLRELGEEESNEEYLNFSFAVSPIK